VICQEERRKLAEAKAKEEEERLLREAARTPRVGSSVMSTPGFGRRYNQPTPEQGSGDAPTPLPSSRRTPRRVGL
jgi:hypothetical protein